MAKATSKLQVTIPKAIADQYGIAPGDEIEFRSAGPQIRVALRDQVGRQQLSLAERLRLFDAARARQREREKSAIEPAGPGDDRGWKREELYTRGHPTSDQAD
jgi:AbrB family looped-hinge helix DNA binding protein